MRPNEIPRRLDWAPRLNALIVQARDNTFVYGEHDCCTFTMDCVKAITDFDPMEEYRGSYSTQEEAAEILKGIGGGGLYEALCERFGPPIAGVYGKKGDVAFFDGCCGIVLGRVAMFVIEGGFGLQLITKVDKVFRVGNGEEA